MESKAGKAYMSETCRENCTVHATIEAAGQRGLREVEGGPAEREARRILAETEPGDGWGVPFFAGYVALSEMYRATGNPDIALAESLAAFVTMEVE